MEASLRTSKVLAASIPASLSVFVFALKTATSHFPLLTDTVLSTTGRGYPDISAQGLNYQIVLEGEVVGINGTSCATLVRFPMYTI